MSNALASNVDLAHRSGNNRDMMSRRFSEAGNTRNKHMHIFDANNLFLEFSRVDIRKLGEEILKFVVSTLLQPLI